MVLSMPRRRPHRPAAAVFDERFRHAAGTLFPGQPWYKAVRPLGDHQVLAENAGLADETGVKIGDDEVVRSGGLAELLRPNRCVPGDRVQPLLRLQIAGFHPPLPGDPEPVSAGTGNRFVTDADRDG